MAEHIGAERLIALIRRAASRGASVAWIDPAYGLVLGDQTGSGRCYIDIGKEEIVAIGAGREGAELPDSPPPVIGAPVLDLELNEPGGRRTGSYRLTLEGRIFGAKSQKQLLLLGLQLIERERPGSLEKLSVEKSRTKRVVSRERASLNKNPSLALKFSERIEGDWWVFTNNSFGETTKFLRRAAFLAGLHVKIEQAA